MLGFFYFLLVVLNFFNDLQGISNPRMSSVTGVQLPSARLVSSMIHADISYLHSRYICLVNQVNNSDLPNYQKLI